MITVFLEYFYWHYSVAPTEILKIMRNYIIARWHQFMIVQHFNTLFSPWHRQNPSDFGPKENKFTDKILDSMADFYIRLIAAGIRLIIIFTGLFVELVTIAGFSALYMIWLGWPAIAIFLISKGLNMVL